MTDHYANNLVKAGEYDEGEFAVRDA